MNTLIYMSNNTPKSSEAHNLLIVDPNPKGLGIINTEDLSISVELKVFNRSNDIIKFTTETEEFNSVSKSNPSEMTRISFIDGTGDNKEHITTHYTELNTQFNKDNPNLETLGIETIDISFNTSYTPIVVIKFKDVRGKLFEMGENSPYNFLFKMPYPIFYLTIKGYYGKAVTYALHLTKFNGALESETGSFTITCDFIGYTYAFLTDILMGYLKAIPYTKIGESLKGDDFISFEELKTIILDLEKHVLNYKTQNDKVNNLTLYTELISKLDRVLGGIESSTTLNSINSKLMSPNGLNGGDLISYSVDGMTKSNIKSYEGYVINIVKNYNEYANKIDANKYLLDEGRFELVNGVYDSSFETYGFLTSNFKRTLTFDEFIEKEKEKIDKNLSYVKNYKLTNNDKDNEIIKKFYEDFINILNSSDFKVNNELRVEILKVLDLRFIHKYVSDLKEEISKDYEDLKEFITEDFISSIDTFFNEQNNNFNSSIHSLFKILCEHVDLFIEVIRNVGISINEDIISGDRNLLEGNRNNITNYDDSDNQIIVRAFPEYVEDDYKNGIVEKWIGSKNEFSEYKEVKFIDDLYESIIKSSIDDEEYVNKIEELETMWYPINPLDTECYNPENENPWNKISDLNNDSFSKLLIQRMVIYLGYTNKDFPKLEEISNMGKIEANQAFNSIINEQVKNWISREGATRDEHLEKIDEILTLLKDEYNIYLKAIDSNGLYDSTGKFLNYEDNQDSNTFYVPINQSVSDLKNKSTLYTEDGRLSFNYPFISTVINDNVNTNQLSEFEYETFIKIIDRSDYYTTKNHKTYVEITDNNITKSFRTKNKDITTVNDSLGGIFKTHEFLNYENPNGGTYPLYYEFYQGNYANVQSFRNEENYNYDTFIRNGMNYEYNENARGFENKHDLKTYNKLYKRNSLRGELISNSEKNNTLSREFKFNNKFSNSRRHFSLFGSEFYYQQNVVGKAYLFLHTLPFNTNDYNILSSGNINYFNQRGGFISMPYSAILFIGAMLHRINEVDDIIKYNNSMGVNYITSKRLLRVKKNELFFSLSSNRNSLSIINDFNHYLQVGPIIENLPTSVKKIFIDEFTNWVRNGWISIKNNLEIFKEGTTENQRNEVWTDFRKTITESSEFSGVDILNPNVRENYYIIKKIEETPNNFYLDIRDKSNAVNILNNFLYDEKILINSTYRIWEVNSPLNRDKSFILKKEFVTEYLVNFLTEFSKLNKSNGVNKVDEINNRNFNTKNKNDIKLSIYKNIKSIYDKWIVGIPQNQDSVIVTNLFKRFNFIDRSYTDISKEFKISPTSLINLWRDNTNVNFYNFIARILSGNNFDFIPLPTFINYKSEKDVRDIFTPFRFNEVAPSSGPQFVCMYFGEQSSQLNIDNSSKTNRDDGINIKVDGDGDVGNFSNIPKDFNSDNDNKIPYVMVNYADQNQSIFKNYKLDQKEFTETQESLEIIESLSTQNRNNSIGQNLFDIYNNRSYSAEIEMLGSAQVQPFMYFQLNNVPMFDGAYTIINTRHSIKANHMTTTFKGVRIREVKTKMIDDETLYAHLLSNLDYDYREGTKIINNKISGSYEEYNITPSSVSNDDDDDDIKRGIIIEG